MSPSARVEGTYLVLAVNHLLVTRSPGLLYNRLFNQYIDCHWKCTKDGLLRLFQQLHFNNNGHGLNHDLR